jgi:hypothetical protein
MTAAVMYVMILQLHQVSAQDLILEDTTITSTASFTSNSIKTGPDFTISGKGDVTLSAETIVMVPQIYIVEGGKLTVISGAIPDNITSEQLRIPDKFKLNQNYPNPFNPTTVIGYWLLAVSDVEINVYNVSGQLVATLVSGKKQAGYHQVEWNALGFASGVYYYRLSTSTGFVQTRKLVLLK